MSVRLSFPEFDTMRGMSWFFNTLFLTRYPSTSPTPNTTDINNTFITIVFLSPCRQLQFGQAVDRPWLSRFLYSMSIFSESASHLDTCLPAVYRPLEGILKVERNGELIKFMNYLLTDWLTTCPTDWLTEKMMNTNHEMKERMKSRHLFSGSVPAFRRHPVNREKNERIIDWPIDWPLVRTGWLTERNEWIHLDEGTNAISTPVYRRCNDLWILQVERSDEWIKWTNYWLTNRLTDYLSDWLIDWKMNVYE